MDDRQHPEVAAPDVAPMNAIEAVAASVGALVAELGNLVGIDRRWLAIGQTDLQTGFMALRRAIAKPETF